MNPATIISRYNSKETVSFKIMLMITVSILAFVPINPMTQIGSVLNGIFFAGLGHRDFYSVLEILLLITFIMLIKKFKISFSNMKTFDKYVLFGYILCVLLKVSNPNNSSANPVMGLALFSDINNYSTILFFYVILGMNDKIYSIFVGRFFKYLASILVIRSSIQLMLWLLGQGNSRFFDINSSMVEMGTLIISALIQNVMIALYLSKRKKIHLFSWIVLLALQMFSFRRTGLYIAIGSNLMTFIIYYAFTMKYRNMYSKIIISTVLFTVLFTSPIAFQSLLQTPFQKYIDRYLGIFPSFHYSNQEYGNDGGQWEQSLITAQAAVQKGFWGEGYGKRVEIEGAYKGYLIHNTWASLWARYGAYMVFYYFSLFIYFLIDIVRLSLISTRPDLTYVMMKAAISSFLILYFIGLTFITATFIEFTKVSIIFLFTLGLFLKIRPSNYQYLFV